MRAWQVSRDAINGTEEAVEGKIPAGLKSIPRQKSRQRREKKETVKEDIYFSRHSTRSINDDANIKTSRCCNQVDPGKNDPGEPEHG